VVLAQRPAPVGQDPQHRELLVIGDVMARPPELLLLLPETGQRLALP
jgi:hypothetical protein